MAPSCVNDSSKRAGARAVVEIELQAIALHRCTDFKARSAAMRMRW